MVQERAGKEHCPCTREIFKLTAVLTFFPRCDRKLVLAKKSPHSPLFFI